MVYKGFIKQSVLVNQKAKTSDDRMLVATSPLSSEPNWSVAV
jgi:hypothetical protein